MCKEREFMQLIIMQVCRDIYIITVFTSFEERERSIHRFILHLITVSLTTGHSCSSHYYWRLLLRNHSCTVVLHSSHMTCNLHDDNWISMTALVHIYLHPRLRASETESFCWYSLIFITHIGILERFQVSFRTRGDFSLCTRTTHLFFIYLIEIQLVFFLTYSCMFTVIHSLIQRRSFGSVEYSLLCDIDVGVCAYIDATVVVRYVVSVTQRSFRWDKVMTVIGWREQTSGVRHFLE